MSALKSLTDLAPAEIRGLVTGCGEPVYRAGQLQRHIYQGLALSFAEMTDLPVTLREKLARKTALHSLAPREEIKGRSTVKTLFTLADGKTIESALMTYPGGRYTVCLSTQVGCPIGCPFCATGQQGFERNLTAGEMVDQVLYFARHLRDRAAGSITNLVFMGMGEPLANYENLRQAIECLNSPEGFGLGARHLTVSTSGLVPQIRQFSRERLQVGLAVSLHAPENALRDRLVPVNKRYPLEELMPACREYTEATGRRLSLEYILFAGVNDSLEQARALARWLKGWNSHVNLIPANRTADPDFRPPAGNRALAFQKELQKMGIACTRRQPRGQDIEAGCGQLRSRFLSLQVAEKEVQDIF
ncbi:MAG: 23S rRNA (adenine(2503)-C(2))-methyltransferase RlmN [Chloroflexota bacterium]